MSVAAVVVANPVIAPRADLQVPAVKLSGTGDALDMLNTDFISSIGPAPTESSSNPFAVLKDLVSSLAADATYLTRNAIVSAFFAGASAVTPELTAASYPYLPPSYLPPVTMSGGSTVLAAPIAVTGTMSTQQLIAAAAALPAEVVPVASHIVLTLMNDVRGISDGSVLTAAFAAGALLVGEGARAVGAVAGLVDDGVQAALRTVLTVVGSGDPAGEIINVLRSAIEPAPGQRSIAAARTGSPSVTGSDPATESPSVTESLSATGSPSVGLGTAPAPSAESVGAEQVARRKPVVDSPVALSALPAEPVEIELPAAVKGGPVSVGPQTSAPVRVPVRTGPLKDALAEARDQVHGALRDVADAMRKAAGDAAKPVAGPARD